MRERQYQHKLYVAKLHAELNETLAELSIGENNKSDFVVPNAAAQRKTVSTELPITSKLYSDISKPSCFKPSTSVKTHDNVVCDDAKSLSLSAAGNITNECGANSNDATGFCSSKPSREPNVSRSRKSFGEFNYNTSYSQSAGSTRTETATARSQVTAVDTKHTSKFNSNVICDRTFNVGSTTRTDIKNTNTSAINTQTLFNNQNNVSRLAEQSLPTEPKSVFQPTQNLSLEPPIFDGNPAKYCGFVDAFDALVCYSISEPKRKLIFLLHYTR